MNQLRLFITGTDTDVGKTHISLGLVGALRASSLHVATMKPVATGACETPNGLRNTDAVALQLAATVEMPYSDVNPYVFAAPIAPHFAAARTETTISLARITAAIERVATASDALVVEGVGGWRVPFGATLMQADVVLANRLSVVLVVGFRLGCVNHALLAAGAIVDDSAKLVGWIANLLEPAYQEHLETIADLRSRIAAPLLAVVPRCDGPAAAVQEFADAARQLRSSDGRRGN